MNRKTTELTKYLDLDIIDRFIKDLIDIYTAEDGIKYDQFYIIDEDQGRIIHLFEVLCQGMLSPALVKFLILKKPYYSDLDYLSKTIDTFTQPQEESWFFRVLSEATEYSLMMSVLSLVLGDYTNFYNNCEKLLKHISPEIDNTDGQDKKQSMLIMSLVHGVPFNPDLGIDFNVEKQLSQEILGKLFGKKKKLAYDLHTFLSRDHDDLIEVFQDSSLFNIDKSYDQNVLDIRDRIMKMLYSNYNFDLESTEWLRSLVQLILGDSNMIEFISQKYSLSPASMDLFEAIVTHRIDEMEPLFYVIQQKVT